MKTTQTFILAFIMTTSILQAQIEVKRFVTTNAGAEVNNLDISLSWTMGEISVESYENDDYLLTNGFQQTELIVVNKVKELSYAVKVYPTPSTNHINIEAHTNERLTAYLFSTEGKQLAQHLLDFSNQAYTIPMQYLPSGNYFLQIVNENNQTNTFKIQK